MFSSRFGKVIALFIFFLGFFMLWYSGTRPGIVELEFRRDMLPSQTAAIESGFIPALVSLCGMIMYFLCVLKEK